MHNKYNTFSIRTIPMYAIFVAISIILGRIASVHVMPSVKIGFKFLATATAGYLFGPIPTLIISVVEDILGATLFPKGPFHFGYLISAGLSGWLYGMVLYKDFPIPKLNWLKVNARMMLFIRGFIVCFLVALVINILLNTYWMVPILGKSFGVLIYPRIISNIIQFPIKAIIIGLLLNALSTIPYIKNM